MTMFGSQLFGSFWVIFGGPIILRLLLKVPGPSASALQASLCRNLEQAVRFLGAIASLRFQP